MQSGNSEKYFRLWQEVDFHLISYDGNKNFKWFPCVKGGEARKWYGNNTSIINWEHDGAEIRNETSSVIRNPGFYFKPGLTWTKITSVFAVRFFPENMVLSDSSVYIFPDSMTYILAFLNSKLAPMIVELLNPTLNFVATAIGAIPIIQCDSSEVGSLAEDNITITQKDWDSFETSWDFKRNPLV